MESRNGDPYEQRLLSVYQSCLEKGELQLGEKGLRLLCEKLQLEERGTELISNLLEQTQEKKYTITFEEFRNGLVNLLHSSRSDDDRNLHCDNSKVIHDDDENNVSDDTNDNKNSSSIMNTLKYEEPTILSSNLCKFNEIHIGNGSNGDGNMLIINGNSTLHHINDTDKQTLNCVFQKLDSDCDGFITFNEFLLFFQASRGHNHSSVLNTDWDGDNSSPATSACGKSHLNLLGPDYTGYLDRRSVVNLWQIGGVRDAKVLLNDLNFNTPHINLSDLMHVLNDEIKSLQHEPKDSAIIQTHLDLLRASLVLYQDEVRSVNGLIDQLTHERDKLKVDVTEANERANLLAAEIDENHAKLEKSRIEQVKLLEIKHAEYIKDITMQHTCERDAQMATLKLLNEQLQMSQHDEQTIKSKLADALNDNQTLEADNQNLLDQIAKLKMSNNQLLQQVQMLAAECDEAEACDDRENEQVISLVDRIKRLQAECSLLRDQNDELSSELELLKSRVNNSKIKMTSVVTFSDSEESNSIDVESIANAVLDVNSPKKINFHDQLSTSSPLPSACWRDTNNINDKKISNIPQTLSTIIADLKTLTVDNKICTLDCALRRNISEIIYELEAHSGGVKVKADEREKIMKNIVDDDDECEERTSESLRDFVNEKNDKSRMLMMSNNSSNGNDNNSDDVINNLDIFSTRNKITRLRDYPPRKDDTDCDHLKVDIINNINTTSDVVDGPHDNHDDKHDTDIELIKHDRDRLSVLLVEQELKHSNEKKILQDRCNKLESDLELLKNEYYQCEDYWAGKLEEEREIIEQEQKVTDEKLSELISKIAEYEEQFSAGDKIRADGRLSPIEEKFNLEQQYTDLEDEFNTYKKEIDNLLTIKNKQLDELNEKLKDFTREKVNFGVQVSDEDSKWRRTIYTSNPSYNYVLPHELNNVNSSNVSSHFNHGLRGKLDKIAEHGISEHEMMLMPDKINTSCCCQQQPIDGHSSIDGLTRVQKNELQRLMQKRVQNSLKCNSLVKQKECLMKEIMDLQAYRSQHLYPNASDNAGGKIGDINCIKNLMMKIQTLEEKKKNLQICIKHLKQSTDKVIEHTWKQHSSEVANLQHVLKETQESLTHQVHVNTLNMEKLAKSDLLLKDLYVENTYLKAKVDCLGERCHMLVNIDSKSTSV